MTETHVKESDVPDVLYRGFDVLEYARAFVDKGEVRLGWLDAYRHDEDLRRCDENEGRPVLRTPVITEQMTGLNRVYLLCCSTDPTYVASNYLYLVRINNPKALIADIREHVSSHPVIPDAQVYARRVTYNRCAVVPKSPEVDEWVDIAYSQKSACFAPQCEYRIAILSRPFADPIDAIFVKLNRRLTYCDLLTESDRESAEQEKS